MYTDSPVILSSLKMLNIFITKPGRREFNWMTVFVIDVQKYVTKIN